MQIDLRNLSWGSQPVLEDFIDLRFGAWIYNVNTSGAVFGGFDATWFLPAIIARNEQVINGVYKRTAQDVSRLCPNDYEILMKLLDVLRVEERDIETKTSDVGEQWAVSRPQVPTSTIGYSNGRGSKLFVNMKTHRKISQYILMVHLPRWNRTAPSDIKLVFRTLP